MEIRGIIVLTLWAIVFPTVIGYLWTGVQQIDSVIKKILSNWVYGFLTMMAIAQILLVPLIALRKSFTVFVTIWCIVIITIFIVSIIIQIKKNSGKTKKEVKSVKNSKKDISERVWEICIGCIAVFLIVLQAFMASYLQHEDADDSRFIAEAVIAVEHDTMYLESPITGEAMGINLGEVKKDLTSPWTMYIALVAKISRMAPAIIAHTFFPFFLILLCYAVYALIAIHFLGRNMEKVSMFLTVLSVFNLFDYTSTHTVSTVMMLRIWQGKAVVAAFIVPIMIYIFLENIEQKNTKIYYALIAVSCTAASLASGIGMVVAPILTGIYTITDFAVNKKWKRMAMITIMMIPSLFYLFCYYHYWAIFLTPWYS